MEQDHAVSSSHAGQGAAENKKRYQIISYETTAFYHYVDAESAEQVQGMIDNFWDEIPDAEDSSVVDSFQEISVMSDETIERP
jgi:hypothetical protein